MKNKRMVKNILFIIVIFLTITIMGVYPQSDTRYDTGMNLPFNEKAGNINPQTGNLTLSFTDVSLPGRGGMHFSFGRTWSLNRANVFNMYWNQDTQNNGLNCTTTEHQNNLGVGWAATLPYILSDDSSGQTVLTLFFDGAYQLDQSNLGTNSPDVSNLLYYDLLDKRIYEDACIHYGEADDLTSLQTNYNVDDQEFDYNQYVLVLKDNSKYYFRPDGKLMKQTDRTGVNSIWYFYNTNDSLCLVVDTLGRKIQFSYDTNGNLEQISWNVDRMVIQPDGSRAVETITKTVTYAYQSAETFPDVLSLKNDVTGDYSEPFILVSVTGPMGNVIKYDWETGLAGFTYNKTKSHWQNVSMLLTAIWSVYTNDGAEKCLNKRSFEYEIPADGMYTKYFYSGYMEYYKVSREYMTDRHSRIMNDSRYIYYDNGEAGNYNAYTTLIETGNITTTYTYTLKNDPVKDHTLDTLLVETGDGFSQLTDYSYDENKTKTGEVVSRNGALAWEETCYFDKKGNLRWYIDKMGLEKDMEYDPVYNIPVRESVKVTVDGMREEYVTERELDEYGRIIKESLRHKEADGTYTWIPVSRITYDEYNNPVTTTDAHDTVIHTVYDDDFHAFPIKIYQEVIIDSWNGGGTVHDNWLTEPDSQEVMTIRSWKIFNSDGSVWLEVDNEGYAIEHFYDLLGIETRTVNPDDTDIPVPSGEDHPDFRDFSTYAGFLTERQNNPGARIYIDYQDEFVHTVSDVDTTTGIKKVIGVQKDGLGNTEQEIEYKVLGSFDEADVTDPNLEAYAVKSMVYDDLGRMIALTDPDAGTESILIKVHGMEVEKYDKTWIVKYDDLGRKKKVLYPSTIPGITHIKQISYDDVENSITTTGPEGRKVKEMHDWNGNLTELIAYGDAATPESDRQHYSYTYDELDRKVAFIDPKGITTKYRYDDRNLLVEQDYGMTGSDIMEYNDLGQLVRKTDRKGQVICFTYDEMGRNTSVVHYESEEDYQTNTVCRQVDTVYDNRGNAVRISNEHLVEHYIYNHSNMVTTLERRLKSQDIRSDVATVWGGNEADQVFAFTYEYNDAGMVTTMTYPGGAEHTFDFDSELGRLSEIGEGPDSGSVVPFVTGFQYNKSGVVTRMDYANNTEQTWEFDNRKRIKQISITGPSGILEQMDYTINGSGDILSINDNEYSYDGFDRIAGAKTLIPGITDQVKLVEKYFGTYDGGDPINGEGYTAEADLNSDGRINGDDHVIASLQNEEDAYDIESFTYDKNGNRTSLVQNGDEYRYEYGERNRLERIFRKQKGETAFSLYIEYDYDGNGNTTRRTVYIDDETTEVITFNYDTMNRLVKTTDGEEVTEYFYDNAGNRFIKKGPDGMTVYLRHGQIAVAMDVEVNEDQSTDKGKKNRYVLSGDLIAGRITTTVPAVGDPTVEKSWYHLDHLNSTKMVTDQNGEIVVSYVYRAFGEQLKRLDKNGNDTDDKAKYSYSGKELDDRTNLYYFNARYYDATIGRFINVDPVQDGGNWYVYCGNNPLCFMDPTGLEEEEIIEDFDVTGTGPGNEINENKIQKESKFVAINSQKEYYEILWKDRTRPENTNKWTAMFGEVSANVKATLFKGQLLEIHKGYALVQFVNRDTGVEFDAMYYFEAIDIDVGVSLGIGVSTQLGGVHSYFAEDATPEEIAGSFTGLFYNLNLSIPISPILGINGSYITSETWAGGGAGIDLGVGFELSGSKVFYEYVKGSISPFRQGDGSCSIIR